MANNPNTGPFESNEAAKPTIPEHLLGVRKSILEEYTSDTDRKADPLDITNNPDGLQAYASCLARLRSQTPADREVPTDGFYDRLAFLDGVGQLIEKFNNPKNL